MATTVATTSEGISLALKQAAASTELQASMIRALEVGVRQAAYGLMDGVCTRGLGKVSVEPCSCHVGFHSNKQIIGNLLHLVVQLALFPTPNCAEQSVQAGTPQHLLPVRGTQTLEPPPKAEHAAQTDISRHKRVGGGYEVWSCQPGSDTTEYRSLHSLHCEEGRAAQIAQCEGGEAAQLLRIQMRSPSRSASSRGASPFRCTGFWTHPGYSEVVVASPQQVTTPRPIVAEEAAAQRQRRLGAEDEAAQLVATIRCEDRSGPRAQPQQHLLSCRGSEPPPRERPKSATPGASAAVAADTGGGDCEQDDLPDAEEADANSPSSGAGAKAARKPKTSARLVPKRRRSLSGGRGGGGGAVDGLAARAALRYPLRRSESLPMLRDAPPASRSASSSVPIGPAVPEGGGGPAVPEGGGGGGSSASLSSSQSPQQAAGRRRRR